MTLTAEKRELLTKKRGTKLTTRIPGLMAKKNAELLKAADKRAGR